MIRKLLPRTAYEKESLFKGFVLFFLTMELFLGVISLMLYRLEVSALKNRLFLELKNYSYTFEGERFRVDIVAAQEDSRFYELLEDEGGLYILVPVPVSDKDVLKITYPRESLARDLRSILGGVLLFFGLSSVVALGLSLAFSLYAINPVRRALNIIEDVNRDIIHDLNTPLMTLRVNLKILKSKYGTEEEIDRAELALKQIETLRENLRPLEAKRELKLEDVDLKTLVETEVEDLRKLYPEKRVHLDLESVKVRADAGALRRIVSNLLENAFKHSLRGSWVRVTLRDSALLVENPSRPPENPDKLFERYYKESQRGLGLGLAIVKRLCTELGWKVQAEYRNGIFRVIVRFR
ncbi:sensor histidine kinase [Hydrogenivirga sp.]